MSFHDLQWEEGIDAENITINENKISYKNKNKTLKLKIKNDTILTYDDVLSILKFITKTHLEREKFIEDKLLVMDEKIKSLTPDYIKYYKHYDRSYTFRYKPLRKIYILCIEKYLEIGTGELEKWIDDVKKYEENHNIS